MEVVICQNCGSILKTRSRTCQTCNSLVSRFGSTALPNFSHSAKALAVDVKPRPDVLERVLVKHLDKRNEISSEEINNFLARAFNIAVPAPSPEPVSDNGDNGHAGNGGKGYDGNDGNGGNGHTATQPTDLESKLTSNYVTQGININRNGPIVQNFLGAPVVPEPPAPAPTSVPFNFQQDQLQPAQEQTADNYSQTFEPVPPAVTETFTPAPEPEAAPANEIGNDFEWQRKANSSTGGDASIENVSAAASELSSNFVPEPEPISPEVAEQMADYGSSTNLQPVSAPPAVPSSASEPDFFSGAKPPASEPSFPKEPEVPASVPISAPAPAPATPSISVPIHDDFFASSPMAFGPTDTKVTSSTPEPALGQKETPQANSESGMNGGLFDRPLFVDAAIEHNQFETDPALHKKVSAPLGYQKKEANGASIKLENEEGHSNDLQPHSGGDEHEDNPQLPHRRSFSGKGNAQTQKKAGQSNDHDHDHEHDDDEHPHIPRTFLNQEVDVLGMKLSMKMAAGVAAAVVIFLFLTFSLFANLAGGLVNGITNGSILNGVNGPMEHLAGRWSFRAVAKSQKIDVKGEFILHQKGSTIFGEGKDNSKGYFQFSGGIKGTDIDFTKQYVRGQERIEKPVQFHGTVTLDEEKKVPFASGDWQLNTSAGMGWRRTPVTIQGAWEGLQTAPMTNDDSNAKQVEIKGPAGDMSALGIRAALIFVGLAIAIFVLARKFFGPDGWNNQLTKQKYIPSQFLGDHKKDVRELSSPLKPGSMPFGQRCEWKPFFPWEAKTIALTPTLRANNPHVIMIGAGDKGKSRLMAKMISHDIESGDRAICVIDSDGGLSELLQRWIAAHPRAKEFAQRVIVMDPTFENGSLSYNPLEMPSDGDLQGAASAIVYGFKAIYTEPPGSQTQWNAQTANILRNAALLLMINNKTLTDLPTLLQENDFRDILLEVAEKRKRERPEYSTLLETWGTYKRLARTDQWITWVEPILNRVTPMLSDPRIRPILTMEKGDIDLKDIIKQRKILIVRIPQGQLDQNANLLGSLLVTGLKQAALTISLRDKSSQQPVALYLDEFDNFIEKETFDAITSETKKFSIGFVGATKSLQDFPEDFRNQLVINVGSMACFSLSKKDGDMLGPTMFRVDGRKKKHETLQNFFNPINTSPQFELISDEEKLNIDRVVGQAERTFYLYRVGTVAGVFHLKSHPFADIPDKHVNKKLIAKMHGIKSDKSSQQPPEKSLSRV